MSALGLHVLEDFRLDVFLKERFDFGVEVGAESAEGSGIAICSMSQLLRAWVIDGRRCFCLLHCERLEV